MRDFSGLAIGGTFAWQGRFKKLGWNPVREWPTILLLDLSPWRSNRVVADHIWISYGQRATVPYYGQIVHFYGTLARYNRQDGTEGFTLTDIKFFNPSNLVSVVRI